MLNECEVGSYQTQKKKRVLIIEDQIMSPYDYEKDIPYTFIVASNIRNGLNLLKYANKFIDGVIISDDVFNPVGLVTYIQQTYKTLPLFIMTENKRYVSQLNQSTQVSFISPPFDIQSIRIVLKNNL